MNGNETKWTSQSITDTNQFRIIVQKLTFANSPSLATSTPNLQDKDLMGSNQFDQPVISSRSVGKSINRSGGHFVS